MKAPRRSAPPAGHNSPWACLPSDVLETILEKLRQRDRVACMGVCQGWRAVASRPSIWSYIEFSTHRDGTRRSELRRLLSLARFVQQRTPAVEALAVSARVPPDCQPAALKAVSMAALAAAGTLQELSLATNRGFWPGGWLPRLLRLRRLHLCSVEGGLSLHGDLSPLVRLTHLALEARQAVSLQELVRLPPNVLVCELSCTRDTLPPPLAQLSALQRLAVRRGVVSEGLLVTEYDCLHRLTALTSLSLERQEDDAWLPPVELLALSRLRHLSIAGNDCSRWPLHGSDEAFDEMLIGMPHLTSLDLAGCGLEVLPPSLLAVGPGGGNDAGHAADEGRAGAEGQGRPPRLRRLLAHGNQLEAEEGWGEGVQSDGCLAFPASLRQLSIDWQVLHLLRGIRGPAALALPPHCRQVAVMGQEGADGSLLAQLPGLLPELRHVLLEPSALELMWRQRAHATSGSDGGGSSGSWKLVGGRWRPARLPGQPRQPQPDVEQLLERAGVQVIRLIHPAGLHSILDRLAAAGDLSSRSYTL